MNISFAHKERINDKIVELLNLDAKLVADKKAYNDAYAEKIKQGKRKASALAYALKADNVEHLYGVFDQDEITDLLGSDGLDNQLN